MLSAEDVIGTLTISCGHDNANTHSSCTSLFVILIFLWVQMQAIQFLYILIEFPFNERLENIVQLVVTWNQGYAHLVNIQCSYMPLLLSQRLLMAELSLS